MSEKIIRTKKEKVLSSIIGGDEAFNFLNSLAALASADFAVSLSTFPCFLSETLLVPAECLRRADYTPEALMSYLLYVHDSVRMREKLTEDGFFAVAHRFSLTAQIQTGKVMSMLVAMPDAAVQLMMIDLYAAHVEQLKAAKVGAISAMYRHFARMEAMV